MDVRSAMELQLMLLYMVPCTEKLVMAWQKKGAPSYSRGNYPQALTTIRPSVVVLYSAPALGVFSSFLV